MPESSALPGVLRNTARERGFGAREEEREEEEGRARPADLRG